MSLAGPLVHYFLSLSSVAVLNMEGGAAACLKGKEGESCWAILRSWFEILERRSLNLVFSSQGGYMCVISSMPQVGVSS